MKNLHTEIEIKAPASKVWEILMDFEKYPEWNPFIKSIKGDPTEGGRLEISLQLPESKAMKFKPRVLASKANSEFRWLGHLIIPGLFDGEHKFRLKEKEGGTTKFVQCEDFKGFLLPLFWKKINTKTLQAFGQMNTALKERAES